MQTGVPDLRLKIPCDDEQDFYARLADHVAERGLRIATDEQRPIGTRVTVALELRNGGTLTGEGIIDAHLRMDARSGVNVRVLRFAGGRGRAPSRASSTAAPEEDAALPVGDEPLGELLFADVSEVAPEAPPAMFGSVTTSGEIVAAVRSRAARVQRAAIAMAAAAVVVGAAGLAVVRWHRPAGPEVAAAHVEAADRLLAEGRLTGDGGALEHLLAAKRLRPDDAATSRRLSRVADLLEGLASRALERGDLAVAAIHLAAAGLAAPDRASIRAKLDAIAKRTSANESPAPPQRNTAGASRRRAGSR